MPKLLILLNFIAFLIIVIWVLNDWKIINTGKEWESLAVLFIVISAISDLLWSIKKQDKQFKDLEFQRLVSNHKNSLNFSAIEKDNSTFSGLLAIQTVIDAIKNKLIIQSANIAKIIICENNPEDLDWLIYNHLLKNKESVEKEKKYFIEKMKPLDFNYRWEFLKNYYDYSNQTSIKNLQTIGSINFYKISFEKRMDEYENAFSQISIDFSTAFNLHLNNMIETLVFVNDNQTYLKQYESLLSNEEKLILFYYMMSAKINCKNFIMIYDLKILKNITDYKFTSMMIDIGNKKVIKDDLNIKYRKCEKDNKTLEEKYKAPVDKEF